MDGVKNGGVAGAFKTQLAFGPFHEEVVDFIGDGLGVAGFGICGGGHERTQGGQADGRVRGVLGGELEKASALCGIVTENKAAEEVGFRLAGIGQRRGFFECIDGLNATVLAGQGEREVTREGKSERRTFSIASTFAEHGNRHVVDFSGDDGGTEGKDFNTLALFFRDRGPRGVSEVRVHAQAIPFRRGNEGTEGMAPSDFIAG